jgi:hypothetical protein
MAFRMVVAVSVTSSVECGPADPYYSLEYIVMFPVVA